MDGPREATILLATCEVRPSASEEPQVAHKGNNPVCNCPRHPSSRGSSPVNGGESGCNEVKHSAEFGVAPRPRTLMRSKTNHPSCRFVGSPILVSRERGSTKPPCLSAENLTAR